MKPYRRQSTVYNRNPGAIEVISFVKQGRGPLHHQDVDSMGHLAGPRQACLLCLVDALIVYLSAVREDACGLPICTGGKK
jgi:hypothetical protein